jgi:ABC-2 type transport system permease protein
MNKKQWFLTFFSIKRKIFKKSFVISNIVLLILISVAANMDTIIKSFGGDFEEAYTIYYVDELENDTFPVFEAGLSNGFLEIENELIIINDTYELKEDDAYVVVVTLNEDMTAMIESNDLISNSVYAAITGSLDSIKLQMTAVRLDLSNEDIMDLRSGVPVDRVVINDEGASEIGGLIEEGLSVLIVMPLFFGLIMIIQMIGLEIFDEKSTKSMEVIMSNVDPKTHLKSKMYAANLFSLLQFGLILAYGAFGAGLRSVVSSFNMPQVDIDVAGFAKDLVPVFGIVIVLYIVTNILYSMVMAILASTANEVDDYQKIISPLMILMVVGFYTAIFSPLIEGATFTKIMAFIPFFSLMIVPGLFAGGQIGIGMVFTIMGVMIVFTYLVYRIGVPIYKQSVLDYSTDNVFKRLISNIKRSRE